MEEDELISAFMKADAAGDTENAAVLAKAIRERGAPAAAQPASAAPAGAIDYLQSLPKKRTFGDKLATGTDRILSGDVKPQEVADLGETAVRAAAAPFGGDFVAAGAENIVRTVTGQPVNKSALRQQRERRVALTEKAPLLSGASEAASIVGGAVNLAARVPQLTVRTGAEGGTRVGNAVRTGVEGGVTAGIAETLKTADVGEGLKAAATGAVATPILGKAFQTVANAAGALPKYVLALANRPNAASYNAIAKRLRMSPDDLETAANNLRAQQGTAPKPSQLLNVETMREFVPIVRTSDDAARVFSESYEESLRELAATLPQTIRGTRQPVDALAMQDAATRAFDGVMEDIGGTVIRAPQIQTILTAARRGLTGEERLLTDEILNAADGAPAQATIRQLENLRKKLREVGKAGQDIRQRGAAAAADSLRNLLSRSNPAYARVFDEYTLAQRRIEGVGVGRGSAQTMAPAELATEIRRPRSGANKTFETVEEARAAATRARGISEGVIDDLANTAGESVNSATRVLDDLQAPNTQARLTTATGPNEAGRLNTAAAGRVGALRNEATMVQRAREEEFPGRGTRLASATIPLAIGRFSGGFAASKAVDALLLANNLRIPPGAAQRMAQILTDNDEVAFGRLVQELRRIGRSDAEIEAAIQAATVGGVASAYPSAEETQQAVADLVANGYSQEEAAQLAAETNNVIAGN